MVNPRDTAGVFALIGSWYYAIIGAIDGAIVSMVLSCTASIFAALFYGVSAWIKYRNRDSHKK